MIRRGRIEPAGPYNQTLEALAHPSTWSQPTSPHPYHLLIVGGGAAGIAAAREAASLGVRVALVERHLLGGDTLLAGAVPVRTFLDAANAMYAAQTINNCGGVLDGVVHVDFGGLMERVRSTRSLLAAENSAEALHALGIDVYFGNGRFVGERAFSIESTILHFQRALLCTGACPVVPEIPGLEESGYLTSDTLFSLMTFPQRLGIIGGGPMGCELAQAFCRLGSDVTLFHHDAHLLSEEEADAAILVQRRLREEKVHVYTSTRPVWMARSKEGIRVQFDSLDGCGEVVVDAMLLAAGRKPDLDGLGLDVAGVSSDPVTGVHVRATLQTTNPAIYAAGDVCRKERYSTIAQASARLALHNALGGHSAVFHPEYYPYAIHTQPGVARVGLRPRDAEEDGIAIETRTLPLSLMEGGSLHNHADEFLRIHLRRGTDKILGATLVSMQADKLIAEIALAIRHGIGLRKLADALHPPLTPLCGLQTLAQDYLHANRSSWRTRLMNLWLRWRQ